MAEFRLPSLGADMKEGKLVEWKVKAGDKVKRGDIIAVVGTDKADIDVEVYESGVVEQLLVPAGDAKLAVGTPLALIRGEGDRPKISPLARKLAEERGIDLAAVRGTGPGGTIESADLEQTRPSPRGGGGMRQAIAAAMARSNREIPHYYLSTEVEMSAALAWLAEHNRALPIEKRVLPPALLLKVVATALRDVPELNGFWADDRLTPSPQVHIGVAISLRQGGLMIPAIHAVDEKPIDDVMGALSDLIQRARSGRLRGAEVTEGTITVTNLGDLGVESVFGVIYPPQVALVGFGRITERPWVENGVVVGRPILTATLAADHRATDGRRGAQFLDRLAALLKEPARL